LCVGGKIRAFAFEFINEFLNSLVHVVSYLKHDCWLRASPTFDAPTGRKSSVRLGCWNYLIFPAFRAFYFCSTR
jgi:hypothetical protein